jgi:ferredoxin-NADP reductase
MITLIDRVLDKITMYRLVLYYLIALLAAALVYCFLGQLPYDPLALTFTAVVILGVCWLTNLVFAWAYRTASNKESVYITALILILILNPVTPDEPIALGGIVFMSVWAIASKYILAINRRHIFNPAALGVALGLLIDQPASWWVGGNLQLLPFVLIGGILVVHKLGRWDLVLSFAAVVLGTTIIMSTPDQYWSAVSGTIEYTAFLFFAFVMITEPLTMPAGRPRRILYAAFVGLLFSPAIRFGSVIITPELALIAGNALAFLLNPKGRALLRLENIRKVANGVYDFVFSSDRQLAFQAGQYVETTLPTRHSDSRGNRRYFTIASAPTERQVVLGVKFYPEPSTFKQALAQLKPGDEMLASPADGSFTLPRNKNTKLCFIAGGIGVTPFRSMIQHLMGEGEARPIVLFYANEKAEDIAYTDIFARAERQIGLRTVYTLASDENPPPGVHRGFIDWRLIHSEMPDYHERIFYISGPRRMVTRYEQMLHEMGIPRRHIRTDFFPGFA